MTENGERTTQVRLDRWLVAARLFKTRALAGAAIVGGKVQVNGVRAKPAKPVQVGDQLRVRVGPYEYQVTVRGVAERRGPAKTAVRLYDEAAESRAARERLALQLKLAPGPVYTGKGRPTKKARRDIERLRDE